MNGPRHFLKRWLLRLEAKHLAADEADREEMRVIREQMADLAC
jgi:hypothetical protein